jgi:hypothetical protein
MRLLEAEQNTNEGRLARAVAADQSEHGARVTCKDTFPSTV